MTDLELSPELLPGLSAALEHMNAALEAGADEFVEEKYAKRHKDMLEGARKMRDSVKALHQAVRDMPDEAAAGDLDAA
jgi:predicted DNA-binding transcriptional regulator YafY